MTVQFSLFCSVLLIFSDSSVSCLKKSSLPGPSNQLVKHPVPVFLVNHEGQLEVVARLSNILQRIVKKSDQLSRITKRGKWLKNLDHIQQEQDPVIYNFLIPPPPPTYPLIMARSGFRALLSSATLILI